VLVHDITRREKLIALQKSNLFLSHIGLLPFKVVDGGGKSKQVLLLEDSKLSPCYHGANEMPLA
jgi:hypothetical protein